MAAQEVLVLLVKVRILVGLFRSGMVKLVSR